MCADGTWVVLIPDHEVLFSARGGGVYEVERRDGTTTQEIIAHVGDQVRTFPDGTKYRVGITNTTNQDRSARISSLSHTPRDDHAPRLTKNRDQLIAPLSVLERAVEHPVEVGGVRVWVEPDDWRPWTHEGVRMGRAALAATEAV